MGKSCQKTPFWWSEHFRKLLGIPGRERFSEHTGQSGDRDCTRTDKERTFAAFAAHLQDWSGRTPYDIEYQLADEIGRVSVVPGARLHAA